MKKGSRTIRRFLGLSGKFKRGLHRIFVEPMIRRAFVAYGSPVRIPQGCSFSGIGNISVGDHVYFGVGTRVLTTQAQLKIGSYVMFGPGVTIITGDHRMDVLGKYMTQLTDADKLPENDMDVVIEDDVWVGANATILKGVTIGCGSVIAAGSLVTKSCPPYSLVGGVPAKVLKARFTPEQIREHESLMGIVVEEK